LTPLCWGKMGSIEAPGLCGFFGSQTILSPAGRWI
jgi:hypothetical protein